MRPWFSPVIALAAGLAALTPRPAAAQGTPPPAPPPVTPGSAPGSAPAPGAAPAAAPADENAPAAPVIKMPVLKRDPGAVYPHEALEAGIHDTAEVPLLLDIDPTGAVKRAVVEKPVGHGFDEAAVEAAQKLEFEPATRDGKPIAVRTRLLYRIAPPPGVAAGRVVTLVGDRPIAGATVVVRDAAGAEKVAMTGADGAWRIEGLAGGDYHITITAPGKAPREADQTVVPGEEVNALDRLAPEQPVAPPPVVSDENVEEVEVRGTKPPREVTKRTLEQREITRIPGTNGDALRSLQNLPGVARPPALAGLLVVRGSAPRDTLYFIDGTPVPLVYHFGGLSSVVPSEMLEKIDFYPGNFSTQYGRAMGGIVDVGLTDPRKDGLHGFAEVDFIDARALAQGPIGDTGWRFALGGRRSWFDLWLGPVLESVGAGVSVAPVYYDYQAILQRDIGRRSSLRFAAFGSDDRLQLLLKSASASTPEFTGSLGSHTGFWRVQALYKNRFSDETELRVNGAFGEDYVNFSFANLGFDLKAYPVTSRIELAQKLDPRLTMNVGADLQYIPYKVSAVLPPLPKPGQPPTGGFTQQVPLATTSVSAVTQPAMYVEFEATPARGTRVIPGIRLDYSNDTKAWDVDPRIVVRQDLPTPTRTTLKGGVGVFSQPPQVQETNDVFGMPGLTSNRAYHYDLGVEHEFTRNIEASLEGFYKQLDNLVVLPYGNSGSGVIYGAETLVRYKPDAHFFGWLAYTLSRSLRRNAPGLPLTLTQFDETHILTVLGSYRLGRGWEFGARFRLTSGYMYTPDAGGFYDENAGNYQALMSYPQFGSRLPLFHALDLRVDKTWKYHGGSSLSVYLDVLNTYNAGNVAATSYNFNFTRISYASDLPFLPSLGLRIDM